MADRIVENRIFSTAFSNPINTKESKQKWKTGSRTNYSFLKEAMFSLKEIVLITGVLLIFFNNSANASAPVILSFTPSKGAVGTLVTITGTDLGNPTAITIGGISAIVVSNTGTSLVAMVMPGATTGNIVINTADGNGSSESNFTVVASLPPAAQQGGKLVGSGSIGSYVYHGSSISISADGNTAIVGGSGDNNYLGAAWIYTREGDAWSQQGSKLVGIGNSGEAQQGTSVSISADGNTAIVGGYLDNQNLGAAWIFTRNGGVWTQQGSKLVGTGSIGQSYQGSAVSISADGNTAIVGGNGDDAGTGAVWVFTRSNGIWSQQGNKWVGTGATGKAKQGTSVSLSADALTAIVGGSSDDFSKGAFWIFTRSGDTWSQQGNKLIGTGGQGQPNQGNSVSLSADGNTAMVGGFFDNFGRGATWVFTRTAGIWSQQGSKLAAIGGDGIIVSYQGYSVSLSADGNTALVGEPGNNYSQGAAWVFTRSGGVWSQQSNPLVGNENTGPASQGTSISISSDGSTVVLGGNGDNDFKGGAWVFIPNPTSYTQINPGEWSNPDNWLKGKVPPNVIPSGTEIIINPGGDGEAILDVDVTVQQGGKITVLPGKKLTVLAGLTVPEIISK